MANDEYYMNKIGELRAQINEVDKQDEIDQNWDELKVKKRG